MGAGMGAREFLLLFFKSTEMLLDEFRGVGRHCLREGWEVVWVLLDAVWPFGNDFGSIYLKQIMQRLAVLGYIELLQRAALIGYCSALLNLAPVSDVMH